MTSLNVSIAEIPIPRRMRGLPISAQGYPIPWFVPFTYGGEPVTQAADPAKRLRAIRVGLCWCCGELLGTHKCFALGPMCIVTRTTSEPACHRDCAEYAVRACPYLRKPNMKRNPTIPADQKVSPGGIMIERNPGVTVLWITRAYRTFRDPGGSILLSVGEPIEVTFFCEGRRATRAEIMESMESGLPILREMAAKDGTEALALLDKQYAKALRLLPQD